MKLFICFVFFALSVFSCKNKCEEKDLTFRPHKVRHCNKSKIYWYYHNNPCDCNGLAIDLCLDCGYQKTYKNFVEYYDNGERVYGK